MIVFLRNIIFVIRTIAESIGWTTVCGALAATLLKHEIDELEAGLAFLFFFFVIVAFKVFFFVQYRKAAIAKERADFKAKQPLEQKPRRQASTSPSGRPSVAPFEART